MALRDRLDRVKAEGRSRGFVPRWLWWIILALPCIFMFLGIGLLVDAVLFVSDARNARGEVVYVSRNYDGEGGVSYTPTFEYRRDDGRLLEAETHISSGGYDYDIGARVDILYSYDNPEEVRINSFFSLYGIGLVFAVVGFLFIRVILFFRRKTGAAALAQVAGASTHREPRPEPKTTDPWIRGHAHKPTPNREPAVRRMR